MGQIMTAELHVTPSRATSSNGLNLDGAKWYFYQTGTTTPQSVYTTAALSTPHSNPVVADAAGKFANIYFDASLTYRGVLKTSDDATTIYDIDPINTDVFSTLAASGGSALVGFLQSGTGAVARTSQSKMREEVSLWDIIPDALRADIEAGTSSTDVVSYINQALTNYKRVIVRNGTYRIGSPVLFAASNQRLEFEDKAYFHPLNTTTNGIAVPHNLLDCSIINPGLIGVSTTETGATGIMWNSNAGGTAPFGSTSSDDMGGEVRFARFVQESATMGWNTFVHLNMAGGVSVKGLRGRGIIGVNSNYGYGVLLSGTGITLRDIDIDTVVANQGRHGIYLGDQCVDTDVSGFILRNFRKTGFAANASQTDANKKIRISNGLMQNVATDADSSATNGAFGFDYQGAATSGGSKVTISNVQINGTGAMGGYFKGFADLTITDVTVYDWGATNGGSYSGLKVEKCDRAQINNLVSRTSATNNAANILQHVVVQESSNVRINGGGAFNTGSGAQYSALSLNATGVGTPNAIIDRFSANKGSGSWSSAPYVNPTQNGSVVIYPKAGAQVTDTQTGADITLDASDGQSVFVLDSGATSVLQILPAGVGQTVTIRTTGNTQIKQTNFYTASLFNATANDTCTLVCGTASGASSLWYEVSRSVN